VGRKWLIAAVVVAVAAIVVAVVAGRLKGNDSSGSVQATAWANSVCSDLVTWRSSITSLADVSGGTLTKDSLRQKLDDAQTATKTLVTNLKDLGRPDLVSGDQLKQELDTQSNDLNSSYQALRDGAQSALNASSPTDFLKALAGLGGDFQRLVTEVQTAVTDIQNAAGDSRAELQKAFSDADSCKQLRSG
jgi:hypothetical protein